MRSSNRLHKQTLNEKSNLIVSNTINCTILLHIHKFETFYDGNQYFFHVSLLSTSWTRMMSENCLTSVKQTVSTSLEISALKFQLMTQICHFSHIHDAYQKGHIYITKGKYHFSNSFLKIKQKYQLHVNPLVVLTYD